MPQKTTKKSTTKKSVKTTAAKATKTTKRSTTVRAAVATPVTPVHECGCGADCKCGGKCGCKCCGGCGLIRFFIKLIVLCMVFLLGCISAPWFMHNGHKSMMRHVQFDENGCVVLESVKCPKMLEALATADDNADGCISRVELKSVFKEMHNAKQTTSEPVVSESDAQ